MSEKVLIIIPAYNEEKNIGGIIQEIHDTHLNLTVLVVDDGSRDNTAQVAEQANAHVISLPVNLGIGGAVQTGYKFAWANDFDIAVQVDGDGQHDVRYLKLLLDPIIQKKADMTIGSRFIPPHLGYQSSFIRRIGINFFAGLIGFLTEYHVKDPTSGFRAVNRKLIKVFSQYYPNDYPEPEAIVVAGRVKSVVLEVPVEMRPRTSGSSSIRYLKTLYYMIKVTFAIIIEKLK